MKLRNYFLKVGKSTKSQNREEIPQIKEFISLKKFVTGFP